LIGKYFPLKTVTECRLKATELIDKKIAENPNDELYLKIRVAL